MTNNPAKYENFLSYGCREVAFTKCHGRREIITMSLHRRVRRDKKNNKKIKIYSYKFINGKIIAQYNKLEYITIYSGTPQNQPLGKPDSSESCSRFSEVPLYI